MSDESKDIVIENATGRNSTYLDKRRERFKDDLTTEIVTITKDTKGRGLVGSLSSKLAKDESISLTKENLNFLKDFSSKMKDGYQAAVPLICLQEDCPYSASCPLLKQGISPKLAEPCAVEEHLFQTWTESKYKELGIEEDNPDFSVDRSQVREHAELEILQYRATLEMAEAPETVIERVVGMDNSGDPITSLDENPRIGVITRISTIKRKLLEDLVATRKSRIATGQKGESSAQTVSRLVAKQKERRQKLEEERIASIEETEVEIVVEAEPVVAPTEPIDKNDIPDF